MAAGRIGKHPQDPAVQSLPNALLPHLPMRNRPNPFLAAAIILCSALSVVAEAQRDPRRIDRDSALRSMERNARNPYAFTAACPPTWTTVTFGPAQAGTGLDEAAAIMTPCGFDPHGPKLPLILILNGYGLGLNSIINGATQIPDEANMRGWMVVTLAQGGGLLSNSSYGIYKSQPNIDFVLNYVIQNYPIDEDRIYGVGWSAGGGAIASYGSRNLDPSKPMLAAIATNAGTYDLVDTYNTVISTVKMWMSDPLMFEGPPTGAELFGYRRSGTIVYNPMTQQVDPPESQARNLALTPIHHVYSTDDPIFHLSSMNAAFSTYLTSLGTNITSQTSTGLLEAHSWDLLDPVATLNFFQQHTVEREPAAFKAHCDRTAVYYWADLNQRDSTAFSTIECAADPTANELEAVLVSNVASVRLSPPGSALDPTKNFTVRFETSDAESTQVFISGVTQQPTYVLDGTSLNTNWIYNGVSSTLRLEMAGAMTSVQSVRFDDYSATLAGTSAPKLGSPATLDLTGSTPNQSFVFFLGTTEASIPLSLFDPADDRSLLVGGPPVLIQGQLNAAGTAQISYFIPNDAALVGLSLYHQFVTLPGSTTLVDQVSNRHDLTVVP